MLLYEAPGSPYAQKIKIALREKGVPFEVSLPDNIGSGSAGGAFVAASPRMEVPALIDGDGKVGHAYGAKTTPHCFVIGKDGKLAYDGAIDDKGSKNYVVDAVKALKEGKAVEPATTKPYGCSVKYARK